MSVYLGLTRDHISALAAGFVELAAALHEPVLEPADKTPQEITDMLQRAVRYLRERDERRFSESAEL